MYKNTALKKKAEGFVDKIAKSCCKVGGGGYDGSFDDEIFQKRKPRGASRRSSFAAELTNSTSERTPLIGKVMNT